MTSNDRQTLIRVGSEIIAELETVFEDEGLYCGYTTDRLRETINQSMLDGIELCLHWLRGDDLPLDLAFRRQSPVQVWMRVLASSKRLANTPLGKELLSTCDQINEWWNLGHGATPPECAEHLRATLSVLEDLIRSGDSYHGITHGRFVYDFKGISNVLTACLQWFEQGSLPPENVFTYRNPISFLMGFSHDREIAETPIGKNICDFFVGMSDELEAAGVISDS